MSFFEDASLVLIPSAQKTSKVYSVKPTDGTGDLTFTRSNDTATRVGPNGLIEKVRTNLITYSQAFDNAAWTKGGVGTFTSAITTGFTDPNGGTNAQRWLATIASVSDRAFIRQLATLTNGAPYTISFWVKSNTASSQDIYFMFQGGAVQATTATTSWQRISYSSTTSTTSVLVGIEAKDLAIDVLVYGFQLETGDIATDYIATTSAAVSVGPVANVPRLDYLGSSCPRLLLEPQRTNLVKYSEQFNNTNSWTRSRTSAFGSGSVVNAVTSPDGYTNAEYIQQATGETDGGGIFTGIAYTSGTTYTLSVFAKQGENRYARIGFGIGSGGAGIFCGFDLQDGIAGTPDTGVTAKIENYGNGWYRCSITATAQITGARNTFVYQSSNLNTFVTTPLQGIYVWGAQLEAASSYATSYIGPTLGAAVTRGADIASITGLTSKGIIPSSTSFTAFFELELLGNESPDDKIALTDSDNTPRLFLYGNVAGITSWSGTEAIPMNTTNKIAVTANSATSVSFYENGSLAETFTDTGANPLTFERMNLNGSNGAFVIKQILFFPTALSTADLAALTA